MTNISKALDLLNTNIGQNQRDKGTSFEQLMILYFKHEPYYQELYSDVYSYKDWAQHHDKVAKDTGIDLVAKTRVDGKYHAIQCKFVAPKYKLSKEDVNSFGFAGGSSKFAHRILVCTTNKMTDNLKDNIAEQRNFSTITLADLDNSVIDFLSFLTDSRLETTTKYPVRPHQEEAIAAALKHFETEARGQLIMACGTGKTFTSLRLAESYAGKGKKVLFMVPSLSLMSQTIAEWTQQAKVKLHSYAVCSDSTVGKKAASNEDTIELNISDLQYSATTNAERLCSELLGQDHQGDASEVMQVVFCTYHSIEIIHLAQQKGVSEFDLIICDEAHRTTGEALEEADEVEKSPFIRIHDNSYIKGGKRLYMTATPRLYNEKSKSKAKVNPNIKLYSMDNEEIYGKVVYILAFAEAVTDGLLTDYKVKVLHITESEIASIVSEIAEDGTIDVTDAAKIIGCWKALINYPTPEDPSLSSDGAVEAEILKPMRRAVAFCQVIDSQKTKGNKPKVGSKQIAKQFSKVVESYKQDAASIMDELAAANAQLEVNFNTECELKHVDGEMGALEKQAKISWLREDFDTDSCRILTNVRCLSEGVDIPALDAVLFLSPRGSMVEVVQAVGRVMRRAENKKTGYVILPVVVPDAELAHKALDKIEAYKTVWQVACALRAHDPRLDADFQKGEETGKMERMEIICYRDFKDKKTLLSIDKQAEYTHNIGKGGDDSTADANTHSQPDLNYSSAELVKRICAVAVKEVGDRKYWEEFATDINEIVNEIITTIGKIVDSKEDALYVPQNAARFAEYLAALNKEINSSVSKQSAIELLAQHYVTAPIFDSIFNDGFVQSNPIARALDEVTKALALDRLVTSRSTLNTFYTSVKHRALAATEPKIREALIADLYESFYKKAFTKESQRLGIVFTPIAVVDFMLRMTNDVSKKHFGEGLASDNTTIIDPFTGTGTFITRLLQSDMLTTEQAISLYTNRLFANEIVLLSYYIASVNIESALFNRTQLDITPPLPGNRTLPGNNPFTGIVLTDTFAMYEAKQDDIIDKLLQQNHARRDRQKHASINVIIGNPPYSKGQKNENDDNKKVKYPALDKRIADTYVKDCNVRNKNSLYDSYIKAFRWATDRLGRQGIVSFITGSGILETDTSEGFRKHLAQDFTTLYFINLRGDIRKNGSSKGEAAEGHNIFGSGSQSGICISILVRDPKAAEPGKIFYYDIGDNLTTKQKIQKLTTLTSLSDIPWQEITPNAKYEWLNQRDSNRALYAKFNSYLPLKEENHNATTAIFANSSSGINTARDAWTYNSSKAQLACNIQRTIAFYNSELERYNASTSAFKFNYDSTKISWSEGLKKYFKSQQKMIFNDNNLVLSTYRPFTNRWLYYDKSLIERTYQMSTIFPNTTSNATANAAADNIVIIINGLSSNSAFSAYISNKVPNYHMLENTQCFPLYLYNNNIAAGSSPTFDSFAYDIPEKIYAIKDEIIEQFQAPLERTITAEDIFYYIYGILHSPCYRKTFAAILKKDLPRIPLANNDTQFQAFAQAGRELANLHLGFETGELYSGAQLLLDGKPITLTELKASPAELLRVVKMKFATTTNPNTNKKEKDRTTIIYNKRISLCNIPAAAYDYLIRSVPAIEWVMDRQIIKTHKNSGITNNANDYAIETMQNPAYPLELLLRVIHISLQTQAITAALPDLPELPELAELADL